MNASDAAEKREPNPMNLPERTVWVTLITIPVTAAVYLAVVLSRAASMPVEEVSWVVPLIWAMGISIVATIAGVIAATIGGAIGAGIRGGDLEDFEDFERDSGGDVRDKEIEKHGEFRARTVTTYTAIAVIILAMVNADQFWIATALYTGGVIGTVYGGIVKILAYRRGIPS